MDVFFNVDSLHPVPVLAKKAYDVFMDLLFNNTTFGTNKLSVVATKFMKTVLLPMVLDGSRKLILLDGPKGSGKTTCLFWLLHQLFLQYKKNVVIESIRPTLTEHGDFCLFDLNRISNLSASECEILEKTIKQASLAGSTIVCAASSCMWAALLDPKLNLDSLHTTLQHFHKLVVCCDDESFDKIVLQRYPDMNSESTSVVRSQCKGYPGFLRALPRDGDISQLPNNLHSEMFRLLNEAINHSVHYLLPVILMLLMAVKNKIDLVHTAYNTTEYSLTSLALGHLISIEGNIPSFVIPLPDSLASLVVKHIMSVSVQYLKTDSKSVIGNLYDNFVCRPLENSFNDGLTVKVQGLSGHAETLTLKGHININLVRYQYEVLNISSLQLNTLYRSKEGSRAIDYFLKMDNMFIAIQVTTVDNLSNNQAKIEKGAPYLQLIDISPSTSIIYLYINPLLPLSWFEDGYLAFANMLRHTKKDIKFAMPTNTSMLRFENEYKLLVEVMRV